MDDEIIARNPCRLRGVASDRTPEQKVATPEEVEHLTTAIKDPYKAMVQVAAYGGLRFGELIGLRRHRIDWKANTIRVVEQVTQPSSEVFVTGPPKTDAGVRTVTMPPEVMALLREHVNKHSEGGRTGLVFPAPEGSFIRRSNFTRRVWIPARDEAGVSGLRFHDLRHTHATMAVANGADTRTLMARMGHASARAALMYQHRQSDQPIADAFSRVIATAKADAAKTTAKAVGGVETDAASPSETASCGTNVARNGLRVVK